MIVHAQIGQGELTVGLIGLVAVAACGIWGLARWLVSGPASPEPWDDQIAAAVEGENALPLCHLCLTQQNGSADFCSECGAPVGQYTNWLPYPYLFSIGHTLRIGTTENFKRSPLIILGFILFALAEYMLFAPVYWFLFLRNLFRQRRLPPSESHIPID